MIIIVKAIKDHSIDHDNWYTLKCMHTTMRLKTRVSERSKSIFKHNNSKYLKLFLRKNVLKNDYLTLLTYYLLTLFNCQL